MNLIKQFFKNLLEATTILGGIAGILTGFIYLSIKVSEATGSTTLVILSMILMFAILMAVARTFLER